MAKPASAGFLFLSIKHDRPGCRDCVLDQPINGRLLRGRNLSEINRRTLTKSEGLANIPRMEDETMLLHETCSGTP
jgi:hypothetical protein